MIFFYIPRDLKLSKNGQPKAAALTTNIEYGLYANSHRLVVAIPEDRIGVSSNKYIQSCCNERDTPFYLSLEEGLRKAVEMIGDGAERKGAECEVPLVIWKNEQFQNWYRSQCSVGNELMSFKCDYTFVMPILKALFCWLCKVHVYIRDEDRVKSNEFVFSRPDMSSVVMIYPGQSLNDTYVVLVKEFRSPGCNNECMVYEIPGGSSKSSKPPLQVAIAEIEEEMGIRVDAGRLKVLSTRQVAATLSAHKVHAYYVVLSDSEFDEICQQEGSVHGVVEDTERTYLVVKSVEEILGESLLDWSNIGMVMSAVEQVMG